MENPSLFTWIVKTNYPDADFWLINKGSKEKLGEPVKEFQPYLTGIKCPALILPAYGFYMCLYLHQKGIWQAHSHGVINLKHLRIKYIKQVFQEIATDHRLQHEARYKSFVPSPLVRTEIDTDTDTDTELEELELEELELEREELYAVM
ncbi:hypothetical protein QUB33_05890 [Microcoleus sp. B3-A4]|uniref:hypothetical protein n=1 Tax=Microcoleus sp. B3-A4 TaxID=2818653 RepID=UPI002FCF2889